MNLELPHEVLSFIRSHAGGSKAHKAAGHIENPRREHSGTLVKMDDSKAVVLPGVVVEKDEDHTSSNITGTSKYWTEDSKITWKQDIGRQEVQKDVQRGFDDADKEPGRDEADVLRLVLTTFLLASVIYQWYMFMKDTVFFLDANKLFSFIVLQKIDKLKEPSLCFSLF